MKLKSVLALLSLLAVCLGLGAAPVVSSNLSATLPKTNAVSTNLIPAKALAASAMATNQAAILQTNLGADSVPTNEPAKTPFVPGVEPDMTSLQKFQLQLDLAREQRLQKNLKLATQTLVGLLESDAPVELKRPALFELAMSAQDDHEYLRAEQIFAQYINLYPEDPGVPDILLRQGLLYRQMGINTLAVSKFYAVMSSALKLNLGNIDYYKKLVLQAQIDIADTYYMEGQYNESADFFSRLLKTGNPDLDQIQTEYKLVRSLSFLTNQTATIARAQIFLNLHTNSIEVPEVRFLLASALKKMGRNNEAMKQVLLLLQSQEENAKKNPEVWTYWQQRAGNEIANQMYKEGDYLSALQIYLTLADLDKAPTWQLPIWYQSALVYEQLHQWNKATNTYVQIINRQKELTNSTVSPSLLSLFEMAKWRKEYIDWMQKAELDNRSFSSPVSTNQSPVTTR